MIQNFKHKGLKQLFESGVAKGVNSEHATRLKNILALLETAESSDDMDLPGLRLHQLKGKRKGTWSVTVSSNWRTTFKIQNGDVFDIDYEDYH